MRVGLLSLNARAYDAVGNHVAETAGFFVDRGAAVRLFVQSIEKLHPALIDSTDRLDAAEPHGPAWEFLSGADLVIAQYAQAYDLLHFLPLLAGGKPRLLLDYHGVTPPALWSGPNREALERGVQNRGLVWCADEVIAHSEFARRELLATTGFPAERIHVVPLVVDSARFEPDDRRTERDVRKLLYVGRLAGNKRVPLLIEALAHLPANVHAVIVGDTSDIYADEAERCRARARALNVADRLHFRGQVNERQLVETYRDADVLVVPSLHEGFCIPVVEAMACGVPVVAARSAALPETVGDAGLTFAPDDARDLARKVERVIESPSDPIRSRRRVAVVCFRFGSDLVGGAETSLRTIAEALRTAGYGVDVFTTGTRSESDWRNELPSGMMTLDGLTVHRFPIDLHDRAAHLEAVRVVIEARGDVSAEQEDAYLRHSIHSSALVQSLKDRAAEYDAIIVGPYLFGLTADVARELPEQTLLLPCFHDEPIGWLKAWPKIYGNVGGLLVHSPEEKDLTVARLGVNCPNTVEVGTWIDTTRSEKHNAQPYIVYCGRYSEQKNVPLLLDWMRCYRAERPEGWDLVCMGQGHVPLPNETWLRNLGRVAEQRKREVLAGAAALVQLSRHESLSLVALEAWMQATPVIVHKDCAVLAGQVSRSNGGTAVADYNEFAHALDELRDHPQTGREQGRRGRDYVVANYGSRDRFLARVQQAIDAVRSPLRERMRQRGFERAARCTRPAWRDALAGVVEHLLDTGPRPFRVSLEVEPLVGDVRAGLGMRRTLIPVRIHNRGTHAAIADGPARTTLWADVCRESDAALLGTQCTDLPALLLPGVSQTAMLIVPVPSEPGDYVVIVTAENRGNRCNLARIALHVEPNASDRAGLAPLLDGIRQLLADAQQAQRLPDDYLDVTQGWFARGKRWIKQKLLNNIKRGYIDVLSRRQSHVNQQLVGAVVQLAECCATLDHAARSLQQQLDAAENARFEPQAAKPQAANTHEGLLR